MKNGDFSSGWSVRSERAAAAISAFLVLGGQSGKTTETTHFEAIVQMNGMTAGAYVEETARSDTRIIDTVDQSLALNRLGSRVLIAEKDHYNQDVEGELLSGHFESSSSKDATTVDIEVLGQTLTVTHRIGSKAYARNVPLDGRLVGPEGVRQTMRRLRTGDGTAIYRTYVPVTSSASKVTLTYQGVESLEVAGRKLQAFKYLESTEGLPDVLTIWTDPAGYTLRASESTPFGLMELVRGHADPAILARGANLPDEVYQRTVAVSNIRIPHPRLVESMRVEITKKPGAAEGWPAFASPTQRVIQETPTRVVLEVIRPGVGDTFDRTPPTAADWAPNAIFQADVPEVRRVAAKASAGETDPWKAAMAIQSWTARHMKFDPGIALVPASEVVRDRHGTCVGYSVLLASLARARGIPARVRMGFVYTGDMWGGHAWDEVFVDGRWLPLDSALYRPGIADAARIAATIETGEAGSLTGVGELARVYGKIDVRTLGYRIEGSPDIVVSRDAIDHVVNGDVYSNAWLGLRITKPATLTFDSLNAHWPDDSVLSMKGAAGIVSVRLFTSNPTLALMTEVRALVKSRPYSGSSITFRAATWGEGPAVEFHGPGEAGVAARSDDQLWMVVANGADADRLLERLLPGIAIHDLAAPCSAQACGL